MRRPNQMRVEPLGSDPMLCVLRDSQGRSLGTGSREVLDALVLIFNRCAQTRPSVTSPRIVMTAPFRPSNLLPTRHAHYFEDPPHLLKAYQTPASKTFFTRQAAALKLTLPSMISPHS